VAAIGAEQFDLFVPELLVVAIKFAVTLRAGHPKNLRHDFPQLRNSLPHSNVIPAELA
jgi:hypothetical protein